MSWRIHEYLRILKDLRRFGWLQRQVTQPESVAGHSFAVGVLAVLAARARGLDPGRAALLALLHDLPEALIGDLVPGELSREEKHRREAEAIDQLDQLAEARGWLVRCWREYEEGASPEAQLVRSADLADAVLQGAAYARQGRVAVEAVQDLLASCLSRIADDEVRRSLEQELGSGAAEPGEPEMER